MSIFDRVKIKTYKRTAFKLSYNHDTTMNIGQVIPTCCIEMVPGYTFRFGQVSHIETQPLQAPFRGELWSESLAFFCSYDSLKMADETRFTELLSGVTDPQHDALPVPKWNLNKTDLDTNSKLVATHKGKLWDYMGFPLNLPPTISDKITPIAYIQRAYNQIYNEYIRDENLDSEVSLDSNDIQTCCYKKDYFTSAFDSPQKGVAPYLELKGETSLDWSSIFTRTKNILYNLATASAFFAGTEQNAEVSETNPYYIKPTYNGNNLSESEYNNLLAALGNLKLDLSRIITFNINDLRLLNKLQEWLERNQIAGTRTKEYLLANYGVAPTDETLQRPQFLGRLRSPVKVSTTIAQSETTSFPQGWKTGNGKSTNSVLFKKWTAKEPGLLMIVSFVRPKPKYSQGINRMWIKPTVYDYFNPIFENLGQQAIYNAEIYCQGTDDDLKFFGYTDRFNEMKYIPDVSSGEMRANQSLDYWSVTRTFAELPTLSSNFIHVDATAFDYLFAIKSTTFPQLIASFDNVVKAIRPLHRFAMPSL